MGCPIISVKLDKCFGRKKEMYGLTSNHTTIDFKKILELT